MSAKITCICTNCGVSFDRFRSFIRPGQRTFCSLTCRNSGYNLGGHIDKGGYRIVSINGVATREHRFIMEQSIGRKLHANEDVHHVNGDRLDNRIENLTILERAPHRMEHHPLTWSIEAAVSMLNEGRSVVYIGKQLGVSHQSVSEALKYRGLLPSPNKDIAERMQRLGELVSQGLRAIDIAKVLDVGVGTVYNYLKRSGTTLNTASD